MFACKSLRDSETCRQTSFKVPSAGLREEDKQRANAGAGEFYCAKRQTSKLPRRTEASSATGRQGRCFQYAPRGASMPAWTVIDRLSLGGFGTTLLRGERGR